MGIKARPGERTIQVRVHFWTDGIASEGRGYVQPRVAWDYGSVDVKANKTHGIRAQASPVLFNRFDDLPQAVLTAVQQADVELRPSGKK